MGCSICLDDFNQEDGDDMRGTALPCGHIFHWNCLQTWFYGPNAINTNHAGQRRCPLCSKQTDPASRIKLYPSDGDDLSTYLTGQRQQEMEALNANGDRIQDAEVHVPRYNQILNDLIDFSTAVQNYAMAAHSIRLENMFKSGVKIRRLVVDLTKDTGQDAHESLVSAMDALENAAAEFINVMNDLNRRVRANKQIRTKLEKETQKVHEMYKRAEQELRNAHAKVADAERRILEAHRRARDLEQAEARNMDLLATIRAEQDALKRKESELRAQQNRIQLETNLKLSNMRNQTLQQLADMRDKVNEALKKCAEAERERALTHDKNCIIAKQLQQAQERLKGKQNLGPPGASTAKVSGVADKDRRIRALEAQLEAREKTLAEFGISPTSRRIVRKTNRVDDKMFVDLTRSSSPLEHSNHDSPATPRDGSDIASQLSTSTAAARATATGRRGSASPTPQRKGKKRGREVSIEPERLDDESNEALYPMPGQRPHNLVMVNTTTPSPLLNFLNRAIENDRATAAQASSTTTEVQPPAKEAPQASTSTGRKSPACSPSNKRKARASDTSSNTSKASSNEYGWLKNASNIQYGPKRRNKAK
ncbi:hypothetical protein NDA16_002393 [Ustilago loliicola]|nr:hypothetical protein NDA16_002393 [Ustilago loliicola]